VSGKGAAAAVVWDLVKKLTREQKNKGDDKSGLTVSQIDDLLLLDRSVDLLSPLATQLTYEGLIDELFGVNNSKCIPPGSLGRNVGLQQMVDMNSTTSTC